jgi:hypothetical protein
VSTESSNKNLKPPPASRQRAVLSLRKDVPLFDMRAMSTSVNAQDIIMSSRNSRPTMMVKTISTNRVSVVEDPLYFELLVSFYPREVEVNTENTAPKLNYKVILPKGWTPRMYLGALNQSIKNNAILSLESVTLGGRTYVTINEVHWLFSVPVNNTHRRLTTLAAYIHVCGGKYQNKCP